MSRSSRAPLPFSETLKSCKIPAIDLASSASAFGVALTPDGGSAIVTRGILTTSVKRVDLAGGGLTTISNTSSSFGVAVTPASAAPTAASGRANEAKQIQSQGKAVTINGVSEANLPGGKAVVIKYTSNSDPNPVTNKRVRLENIVYIFYKNGKEADIRVWAPQGADNVDQWNRMANSFRWQ